MTLLKLVLLSVAVSCSGQQEFFSISWGDGDDSRAEFTNLFDDVAPIARVLSPEPSLLQDQREPPARAPPAPQSAPPPFQQRRPISFNQQQNSFSKQLDPFPQLDAGSQQRANFFPQNSSEQNFGAVTKVAKPQLFFSHRQNDPVIEQVQTSFRKQQEPPQQQLPLNPQEEHQLALKQQQEQIAFQQIQHHIATKKQRDIIASEKKQQDYVISQRGQPTERNEIFQPLDLQTSTSIYQEGLSQMFEEETIQEIVSHHQQETIFFPKLGNFGTSHTMDAHKLPLDPHQNKQRNIPQKENNLGEKSKELSRNPTSEQAKKILKEKSSSLRLQKIGEQLEKATNIAKYEEVTVAITTEVMEYAAVTRPPRPAMPTKSTSHQALNDGKSSRSDEPLVDSTSQLTSDIPQDLIQDLVENVSLIENLVKSLGELEILANEVLYIQEETTKKNTYKDRKEKIKHRIKYRDDSIDYSSYEVYDEKEEFEDYRRPRRNY